MIEVFQGDITKLDVDGIVNAANSALAGGGGVDGAIHRAAGPELAPAAMAHGRCPPGYAVRTPGFGLRARFVIHAVGPVWDGGEKNEDALLASAYQSSFERALEAPRLRSLAFPCISTGVYAFPKERAARIAVTALRRHEAEFERLVACVFDAENRKLYEALLREIPP